MTYEDFVPILGGIMILGIIIAGIYRAVKSSKSGASKDWVGYSRKFGGFTEERKIGYLLNWFKIDSVGKYVICKDGSVMTTISFRGPDMDSSTKEEMNIYMARLNQIIRSMGTGYSLYFDAQRHFAEDYKTTDVDLPLLKMVEDERKQYYSSATHFETDFYLTLCQEKIGNLQARFTDALYEDPNEEEKDKASRKEKDIELYNDFIKKFLDMRNQVVSMMEKVMPEVHVLDENELATYLHNCVSPDRHPLKNDPFLTLSDYVFDGTGVVGGSEMRIGDKYTHIITPLTSFPAESAPGFFDSLNRLNIEYRWVSRFVCLGKNDADKELEQIEKNYNQTAVSLVAMVREAITKEQTTEVNQSALDNAADAAQARKELNDDSVSYGYYSMTMIVMDKDKKRAKEKADAIREVLVSRGFSALIEGMNSLEAWWGSLPGHYRANIRRYLLHSLSFCHFLPLTAIWPGDERNKHLNGPALLYTDTQGFTPFRFNLHVGDVGHTMVVGPTGAGKSVLLNMLELHFLKYKNSNVFIFDKAASSRALTMAVGGNFYNIASEKDGQLSFQPLSGIDDETEMRWAQSWIMNFLKSKQTSTFEIGPKEEQLVWNALLSLKTFEKQFRTISTFSNLVQDDKIRMALLPLTQAGAYGKLFDNDKEVKGNGRWQVYEMETLMNLPEAVPLTLDYLFHRIEQQITNAKGPSIMVMDECWLFLDNPIFAAKLKEYLKDMRKKNTSIVIATQNLSDIVKSAQLIDVVKEQCKSKIFLPNPLALTDSAYKLYSEFNLNDQQIRLIQAAVPKQDYYYTSEKGNRLVRLAIRNSELPFVTATSKDDQTAMNDLVHEFPEILAGNNDTFIREWYDHKGFPDEWEKYISDYKTAAVSF